MYGYIYLTTNLITGKQYIGKHHSNIFVGNKYLGSGKILKQAIEKYGKENFTVELLKGCETLEELNAAEIYYIDIYNARTDSNFYNIRKGGDCGPGGPMFSGHHHTEDTKVLMSINRKGELNPNYGNHWTQSADLKALHSKLSSGESNGMYGKTHTEEAKATIGKKNHEALFGRIRITDGVSNKLIPKEDLQYYLDAGWYRGQTFSESWKAKQRGSTGKVWIHNNIISKYVDKEQLDDYLNSGWIKGRIFKSKIK